MRLVAYATIYSTKLIEGIIEWKQPVFEKRTKCTALKRNECWARSVKRSATKKKRPYYRNSKHWSKRKWTRIECQKTDSLGVCGSYRWSMSRGCISFWMNFEWVFLNFSFRWFFLYRLFTSEVSMRRKIKNYEFFKVIKSKFKLALMILTPNIRESMLDKRWPIVLCIFGYRLLCAGLL